MRLGHDDSLHSVDDVFLGPPSWSFPFRVRYRAYGVGFVVFIALLSLERAGGVGFSFGSLAWGLLLTVAITSGLMQLVTHDRPLRSVAATFWSELTGPRPPSAERCRLEPSRVRLEPSSTPRFCGRRRRGRGAFRKSGAEPRLSRRRRVTPA
jgi:hypothetical protein